MGVGEAFGLGIDVEYLCCGGDVIELLDSFKAGMYKATWTSVARNFGSGMEYLGNLAYQ